MFSVLQGGVSTRGFAITYLSTNYKQGGDKPTRYRQGSARERAEGCRFWRGLARIIL